MVARLAILILLASGCFAQPRRIVSTAPSITEMLYALGLGDRVMGVTTFCRYPPEAARKPRIGNYLRPDVETIVASVKKTGRLVGLTEAYENTSFINEVMVQVNERAFDYLDAPMVRVASANVPVPRAEVLEDLAIPNVSRLVEACRKVMS